MLEDAAAELNAAEYKQRGEIAQRHADLIGCSKSTLYRKLRKAGLFNCQRKIRADAGTVQVEGVDDEQIKKIAALMLTSKRNQGRIIMPASVAIEMAEAQDIIPKGVLTEDTFNRHLRRLQASKRALLAAEPHTQLRSLHPNHVHQLDYSVCVQWYLDKKGLGERNMQSEVYKNKPDNVANAHAIGKPKLIRALLTDHFSGLIHLHYYYIAGESATMAVDFLSRCWLPKETKNPFHGVPTILMIDKTGAHRRAEFLNYLDALDVKGLDHKAGNSKANGSVEGAQWIVEQQFESRLRISPAKDLESLNTLAAQWCLMFNAKVKHSRHHQSRAGLWQTIRQEHLRVPNATLKVLKSLACKEFTAKKCANNFTVKIGKDTFKVAGIDGIEPGVKIMLRKNMYQTEHAFVRLTATEPWIEVEKVQVLSDMEGGFASEAPVIGQAYQAQPETTAQKNEHAMQQTAYGTDNSKAAENARKRREKPFKDVDAFAAVKAYEAPSFMKRKGTSLPIEADLVEQQPMSVFKACLLIAKTLNRAITPAENKAIRQQHPSGLLPADVHAATEQLQHKHTVRDQLRAV